MQTKLTIDYIADIVCPWCYIGWRRLGRAIAQRPEVTTELVWQPYQLDPSLPDEGVDRKAYMAAKFAGVDTERRQTLSQALQDCAAEEGLVLNFGDIPWAPNTNAAHRLIRWASGVGAQDVMVEALMKAYFTDLRDIGDPVTLADIAGDVGLDRLEILRRFSEDIDRDVITREHILTVRNGVSGVPYMIFNGHLAAIGAETPERLLKVIDTALREPTPG